MRKATRYGVRLGVRITLAVSTLLGDGSKLLAQVEVIVPVSSITTGTIGSCTTQSGQIPTKADSATIRIHFVSDAAAHDTAKASAVTAVQIDGRDIGTIDAGASDKTFTVSRDRLNDATISVMRNDAHLPLCSVVPWPRPVLLDPSGPSYTSFVADGAVGKVLRGAAASDVTGSIGIDHRSIMSAQDIAREGAPSNWITAVASRFVPWQSEGEEFHGDLTIASSADSLASPESAAYGAALLAPSLSGSGSIQGAMIEYSFFNRLNRSGGTWGPRFKFVAARSLWRVIDSSSAKRDTLRQNIPLAALDVGLRLAFINHLEDARGNTFAMGFDPSVIWRFASPNSSDDNRAVRLALGTSQHRAFGYSVAYWIRLRQVTATADFSYIPKPNKQAIDGLTGFQPTVTMRYSSPLFTL